MVWFRKKNGAEGKKGKKQQEKAGAPKGPVLPGRDYTDYAAYAYDGDAGHTRANDGRSIHIMPWAS